MDQGRGGHKVKIDTDMRVSELLEQYPETGPVFNSSNLPDFTDNDLFKKIAPFIRLKTLLKAWNINQKIFMEMLEEKIQSKYLPNPPVKPDNLLALLPCPLKVPLQQAFENYYHQLFGPTDQGPAYLIEGNANNQLSYYSYVDQFEELNEMPDVIITPGLNSFYHHRFIKKFIDQGLFIDAANFTPNPVFKNVKDPRGNYTIIAMNLLVMVIDHTKLGKLELPQRWEDILNPEFEKKVAIRGQQNYFCETSLLAMYQAYGLAGIRKFGRSVKYGWHPSQMAKLAGSGQPEAPAVSIMPYFFTRTIRHKANVTVVWPEDGAIISPVTMLVKAEKAGRLKPVTDFFTGPEVGKICSGACFPSLHPEVRTGIPEDVPLNWLGWGFIRDNDIGQLTDILTDEFRKYFNA